MIFFGARAGARNTQYAKKSDLTYTQRPASLGPSQRIGTPLVPWGGRPRAASSAARGPVHALSVHALHTCCPAPDASVSLVRH